MPKLILFLAFVLGVNSLKANPDVKILNDSSQLVLSHQFETAYLKDQVYSKAKQLFLEYFNEDKERIVKFHYDHGFLTGYGSFLYSDKGDTKKPEHKIEYKFTLIMADTGIELIYSDIVVHLDYLKKRAHTFDLPNHKDLLESGSDRKHYDGIKDFLDNYALTKSEALLRELFSESEENISAQLNKSFD